MECPGVAQFFNSIESIDNVGKYICAPHFLLSEIYYGRLLVQSYYNVAKSYGMGHLQKIH